MSDELEREKFEEWASSHGWDVAKQEDGDYADYGTDCIWTGWLARSKEKS